MPRLRRAVLCVAMLLGGIALAGYLARGRIATAVVARAVEEAQARAAARGLRITDVEPGRARLTGPLSLECEGLRGRIVTAHGVLSGSSESYAFVARRLHVRLDGLFSSRLVVTLTGGSLYRLEPDGDATGEWLSDLTGHTVIPVSLRHPRQTIAALESQSRRLLTAGAMDLPARIRGRARFLVRGNWFDATVYSETDGKTTRVLLDKEDVRRVSEGYRQPLTETEIDLVADFPTRAPRLMQITDRARRVAYEQRQADRSFPHDAFRHIYWSYWLTRDFGPEFAQRVTDAHEVDPTYETGEANRRMDLHNNALGREYAVAGVHESELAARTRTDPRVIRSPKDVRLP